MDTRFITPVLYSIDEVFSLLVKMEVERGELKIKDRNEFVSIKSIAGNMNLISNNALASITIICPDDLILKVANKILPEKVQRVNDIVIDFVGEITNMVAGSVKRKLEAEGYLFDLSLPTMILGREYCIAHLPQSPVIQVDLFTELGEFSIETSFCGIQDFCPLKTDLPEEFDDILF